MEYKEETYLYDQRKIVIDESYKIIRDKYLKKSKERLELIDELAKQATVKANSVLQQSKELLENQNQHNGIEFTK